QQLAILRRLTDAEVFEQFIHRKFLGAKRFSLEGGESLIPLMALAIEESGMHGVEEVVIGMAHRGRLNVMANILGKSPAQIFREFADLDPELYLGRGDVKYHLGHSSDWTTEDGKTVHLTLCFNPSHLECVGPVVQGRVRAKQHRRNDADGARILPFIIHGDAAIAGEGVVQEMLNMSGLAGYRVGGSVHLVLNNQIGFTTTPDCSRSTRYATDLARMLQVPIWHVNGEDPEAVVNVVKLAMEFRTRFQRDVIIDMYCYRRYGHNEGDEPAFTQPLLYEAIRRRKSVREHYVANLIRLGEVTKEESDAIATASQARLDGELERARDDDYVYKAASAGRGLWEDYVGGEDAHAEEASTRIAADTLRELMAAQAILPKKFNPHPKMRKLLKAREEMAEGTRPFDWGGGEALAFASLLNDGHHIRLSGQDSERGTFSHRHSVLTDIKNGRRHTPLASLKGHFEVINSPLSETAVLGFDYGYSLDYPDGLVIWEAQFGDFVNVAQVIIDQFISSAEDKWERLSGLVMLLPHGFEGQGPEHSSARLERFLTLAAEDNMQIVNLTTPAQLFHCLRRQVVRPFRKPLIVMSPKSLLRHHDAVSSISDFTDGEFLRVIADGAPPKAARTVLLCSGKLFYELELHRKTNNISDVALVRLEQYYPLSADALNAAIAPFGADVPLVWVQEEPENMGAWPFLHRKLPKLLGRPIEGVARPESASPATGSAAAHKIEQKALIEHAFR
ncbi:MAG: 2-oxoglutarate dehydrogenase E1 component, partial [Myxococcota bacterium]